MFVGIKNAFTEIYQKTGFSIRFIFTAQSLVEFYILFSGHKAIDCTQLLHYDLLDNDTLIAYKDHGIARFYSRKHFFQ